MMQDPREQQIVSGGQVPPGYPAPAAYYGPPVAVPARPSRFTIFRRGLRLMVRRSLYGLILVGRALRPVIGWVLAIVALLAVIGWMAAQLWMPKGGAAQVRDVRVSAVAPVAAVESYIKGQQSFNADQMWSAYSPTYQSSQLQKGATKASMQASADTQRARGLKFSQYDYVGGVPADGGFMYYYAVKVELQGQQGKLPLIVSTDKDGKITRVIFPFSLDQ